MESLKSKRWKICQQHFSKNNKKLKDGNCIFIYPTWDGHLHIML